MQSCCGFVIILLIDSKGSNLVTRSNYDWETVLGGIPQGSALGHLLFLINVNDMPLQVKNGVLVQFSDDTCLICCGDDHSSVVTLLFLNVL